MKKLILILALIASSPAVADELTAGDLYSFCNADDEMTNAACRFYILGAVQGISFGGRSVMDSSGRFVTNDKRLFCIPDDTPQSELVAVFQRAMGPLAKTYPQDLKLSAISVLAIAIARAFPCPKSN
jgi:hypothetical protein